MKRILACISAFFGALFNIPLPRWLRATAIKIFSAIVGAQYNEASLPLEEYRTLAAFFLRDLKPGSRPIGDGITAPADGILRAFGAINSGVIPSVKGVTYSVSDLVGDAIYGAQFASGSYLNLYLAPKNYHHVHIPLDAVVEAVQVIAGMLYPVNALGLLLAPDFPVQNERVCIRTQTSRGKMAIVMIGALNVGKIAIDLTGTLTNQSPYGKTASSFTALTPGKTVAKGDRLGSFHLGSSVVVLFEHAETLRNDLQLPSPVLMGQKIG
jgi:phosphatidylserine decarboxylase